MVRLRIDNIEVDVPEGTTILKAAKSVGIFIPTLCHKDGLPHYSSCMVCMVKDNTIGFLPSCSALVQNSMDIDASGDGVKAIRKTAVELLLSEHRAECEAPCRIVCPAGYSIPLMNRLLASGEIEAAVKLSLSEHNSYELHCTKCSGYCENACRRKKVDTPVSIRNLQIFINRKIVSASKPDYFPDSENISHETEQPVIQNAKSKRYRSLLGRIDPDELTEWLKECKSEDKRFREVIDDNCAVSESGSCMHCDCRASEDCRLREIADELSIKDPRGKLVYAPAAKKINLHTNLIFENAKCIKCGLCVRVCVDNHEDPPLCFIKRGFISTISEPLTCEFIETMKATANKCIEICPTGALASFK